MLKFCKTCGEALSEEANFCQHCGALTEKGAKDGLEPYWGSDVESRLRLSLLNLENSLEEVAEIIEKASEQINPQFEKVKKQLVEILEEVGNELEELEEKFRNRT